MLVQFQLTVAERSVAEKLHKNRSYSTQSTWSIPAQIIRAWHWRSRKWRWIAHMHIYFVDMYQRSWMEEERARMESRTRMAFDQSRERQNLASSTLSGSAEDPIVGWMSWQMELSCEEAIEEKCTRSPCSFLRFNGLVVGVWETGSRQGRAIGGVESGKLVPTSISHVY